MKILGITGGVGAGKSTILDYLEEKYHARVIKTDEAAHLLQQPGQSCYQEMIKEFGTAVLDENGKIDRAHLGKIVFSDPEALQRLNEIMHPAVKAYVREEIEREGKLGRVPFLVVEAALLLEDHYDDICDEIWYIYTEQGIRIKRLKESRGYSEKKSLEIMKNQLPEERFFSCCQFVVDNSSDFVENTYEQIDKGLVEHGFL